MIKTVALVSFFHHKKTWGWIFSWKCCNRSPNGFWATAWWQLSQVITIITMQKYKSNIILATQLLTLNLLESLNPCFVIKKKKNRCHWNTFVQIHSSLRSLAAPHVCAAACCQPLETSLTSLLSSLSENNYCCGTVTNYKHGEQTNWWRQEFQVCFEVKRQKSSVAAFVLVVILLKTVISNNCKVE